MLTKINQIVICLLVALLPFQAFSYLSDVTSIDIDTHDNEPESSQMVADRAWQKLKGIRNPTRETLMHAIAPYDLTRQELLNAAIRAGDMTDEKAQELSSGPKLCGPVTDKVVRGVLAGTVIICILGAAGAFG